MGSFQTNGTSNISGNVTSIPQTFTVQQLEALWNNASASTINLGTVPAGKQWRIIFISIHSICGNAVNTLEVQVNGLSKLKVITSGTTSTNDSATKEFNGNYQDSIIANAGEVVRAITTQSAGNVIGSDVTIYYIEVSV